MLRGKGSRSISSSSSSSTHLACLARSVSEQGQFAFPINPYHYVANSTAYSPVVCWLTKPGHNTYSAGCPSSSWWARARGLSLPVPTVSHYETTNQCGRGVDIVMTLSKSRACWRKRRKRLKLVCFFKPKATLKWLSNLIPWNTKC